MKLELGEGSRAAWESFLSGHPLPRGHRLVEGAAPAARAAGTIRVIRRGWSEPSPTGPAKAIAGRTLAAAVPLLSPLEDIPLSSLSTAEAAAIVPLEEVRLPRRLVSVDGRYPDAAGYPLREETLLSLTGGDKAMASWLDAIPALSAPPPVLCWVAAVGDIMLDRGVDRLLTAEGGEQAVFRDTLPVLRSAAVVIGNLESAVTSRTAPARKAYTFRVTPGVLPVLREVGFTYLTVANNHSFDYGLDGFVDTLGYLRSAGIGTSGAGTTLEQAMLPYTTYCGGIEMRIWSLGAYPAEGSGFDGRTATAATPERAGVLWATGEPLETLTRHLALGAGSGAAGTARIVVVHGGEEWRSTPGAVQRELYRRLAGSGADLVIGSHPHVLQGIEASGRGLILYSLGNFVFPGMQGMAGATDSVIALVGFISGRVVALRLVPVALSGGTVRLAGSSASRDRVLALSRALAASP